MDWVLLIMSIKSTHLALDYSETLKRSRLNEEASVARRFHPLGWRVPGDHRIVLADCGFEFEAEEEDNRKR